MKFIGTHLAIIAAVVLTLVVQVINHLFVLLNKSDENLSWQLSIIILNKKRPG
jgi:hypothetical protein